MEAIGINTRNINEVRQNISTNNKLSRLQYIFNHSNPLIKDGGFNSDFIQLHACKGGGWCEEVMEIKGDAEPFRLTSEEFSCSEPAISLEDDFLTASIGEDFCDSRIEDSAPINVKGDLENYPLLKAILMQQIDPAGITQENFFNFESMALLSDFSLEGYKRYNPDVVAQSDNDYFIVSQYLLHRRRYRSSDV